ncbi:MAG: hypothetical protein ACLP8B_22160 [Xanthobacteraceae bacterium]
MGAERNLHQHWMCVMRIDPAAVLDVPSTPRAEAAAHGLVAEIGQFWRQFMATAFNSYHPEKHYMRGPGPAWHAKHMRGLRGDDTGA